MLDHLTIAFAQLGDQHWQAGQTLVTNSIRALRQARPGAVRVYVVGINPRESAEYACTVGADSAVPITLPARLAPRRIANAALTRFAHRNLLMEASLRNAGVQVLVDGGANWQLGRIATVSWLQDFQHHYLPHLFDTAEVARRDRTIRRSLRLADRVLAYSSVVGDARRFAPQFADKIRPVRPLTILDSVVYERDPGAVVTKYSLPDKFFYVPNTFWAHKNHSALLEALHQLAKSLVKPHLVLTGASFDQRHPDHFRNLMRQAEDWSLQSQLHYLGVVQRSDVYDLIRQSICVVNPSYFEGWGYSVDEAAAIGKRILASEIPAHRAQAPPACEYFNPADCHELAMKLARIWETTPPGPSAQLEADARNSMPDRISALGLALFENLQEAVVARLRGSPNA